MKASRPRLLLLALAATGITACGHSSAASGSHRAAATTSVPVPAATATPGMLLFETGTGNETIPTFQAPSDWELKTIWDCPSGVETISVEIDNPDGTPAIDQNLTNVNNFDATGTDTEQEHKAGTYSLSVMTDCNWTITAQAQPSKPSPSRAG